MGLIDNIKNLLTGSKNNDNTSNIALDYDIESDSPLFKEDIIRFVLDALEQRRGERDPLEKQWILNSNFLIGNQYCDINVVRGEVEQQEPLYDWLEQETFNRIAPLIETRIANLKKINYMMKVNPRTNELDDYAKADVSTKILQHIQTVSDFETKKNTMITWNELCGNCFWLSWWDKDKGEEIARETVTLLDENGVEYKKDVIYHDGDIDYGLITPWEIFPESIFKQGIRNQRSIILEQVKSVDEIFDLYGIRCKGSEIQTFQLTPIHNSTGLGRQNTITTIGHRSMKNSEKVITYFEVPSRKFPHGRMIIIVGTDKLVYYGDLPYGRIPIEQVICKETAGQFFGRSVIEDLIPLQRAYNGVINRIHEYIQRLSIGGFWVEEGSIDMEQYTEEGCTPGAALAYKRGYHPPTPFSINDLPSEVMTERNNLVRDMEYVAGVSQMMVTGNTPNGVTSGTAIENLRDIDNTRLSLTGDYIRNSVKNVAILWLEIYKRFVTTSRVVQNTGNNKIGNAISWCADDINSYDVVFTTENELLMSEDVQKQRFFEAFNAGLFTDSDGRIPNTVKREALKYMKVGDYSSILGINELHTQAAQRENTFFEQGVFPEVSEFDNHEIHIDEHMRYILQMEFQVLKMKKPEYAQAMENHIKEHQRIIDEKQTEQMQRIQALQQMQG